jgi:hypothetical protein
MVTPPLESANRAWEPAENSPGFAPKIQQVHSQCRRRNGMPFGFLFTAQPKAPAFMLAGASGWAVNGGSGKAREVFGSGYQTLHHSGKLSGVNRYNLRLLI